MWVDVGEMGKVKRSHSYLVRFVSPISYISY
jgi:hypothetical protein